MSQITATAARADPMSPDIARSWQQRWRRGVGLFGPPVLVATTLSVLMIGQSSAGGLGLPPHWPWILTLIQVSSLGLIGRGIRAGWLFGAAIQASWICYATLTDQLGFIVGCALSMVIHVRSRFAGRR